MKKLIVFCMFALFASAAAAEEMKFVTLLSQPVGSFARVELLDSSTPADIFHLNFCNIGSSGGTITVSGTGDDAVNAEKLEVQSGAVLGGNVKHYELSSSMTVKTGANFKGGTLQAGTANAEKILVSSVLDAAQDAGGTAELITDTINAKVASFNKMTIDGKAVFDTPASGDTLASSMGWNQVAMAACTTALSSSASNDLKNGCKAYLLTGTPSSSPGGDATVCGGKTCNKFTQKLNTSTCECESTIVSGGDFESIERCPNTFCMVGQTLNKLTCKCEGEASGFIPGTGGDDPCPGVTCTNGAINILTCKCVPYAVVD